MENTTTSKPVSNKKAPAKKAEFVTVEKFSELESSISALTDLVAKSIEVQATTAKAAAEAKALIPETPLEKEIAKAGPAILESVNPEWVEIAKAVIGPALERCEEKHLRNGGLLFTIVIKKEFSNAPDNYLAEFKEDRRTKEIGAEGIGGVENWCKLVKQNLSRAKPREITN
jgi:hypothetical protein